jgi:hypothetical protein
VDDKALSLAFSMQSNPGVYALLLGSGVSRSAGIPTGWEIVEDLCRKLAALSGEVAGDAPADWYRAKFGKEARYDDLLEALARTPEERRNLLSSYFVPTEQEQEQGKKLPTAAHQAIAELVKNGYVKVILTTNFDRLMESALEGAGVSDYTVIAHEDALQGVRPYVHARCTVVKLHGDWKDSRLRNTAGELSQYPPAFDGLLDRVLDEFGLVVAGWSAAWDEALKRAVLRSPSRRYSWYWLTTGEPNDDAQELIRHRDAVVVRGNGADEFFQNLQGKVKALTDMQARNPVSVQVAVATTKRLLSEERFRIDLHDLVTEQVVGVLKQRAAISTQSADQWPEEAHRQVGLYESHTEILRGVLGTVGFFGDQAAHGQLVRKAIERLGTVTDMGGLTGLIALKHLPALLVMYTSGVAAVGSGRWENLRACLLDPKIPDRYENATASAAVALHPYGAFEQKSLVPIQNAHSRYTPVSEYLAGVVQRSLERFLPTQKEYDAAFDTFEYLYALVFADRSPRVEWTPIGRFGWRAEANRTLQAFLSEGEAAGRDWPVIEQLFDGDSDRFNSARERVKEIRGRRGW